MTTTPSRNHAALIILCHPATAAAAQDLSDAYVELERGGAQPEGERT